MADGKQRTQTKPDDSGDANGPHYPLRSRAIGTRAEAEAASTEVLEAGPSVQTIPAFEKNDLAAMIEAIMERKFESQRQREAQRQEREKQEKLDEKAREEKEKAERRHNKNQVLTNLCNSVKEDINSVKTEINSVKTDINSVKTDLQTEINDLNTRLNSVKAELKADITADLNTLLGNVQSQISSQITIMRLEIDTQVESKIEDISKRLDEKIEAAKGEINSKVIEYQKQAATLKEDYTAISDEVKGVKTAILYLFHMGNNSESHTRALKVKDMDFLVEAITSGRSTIKVYHK
ncbi:uncharacterized protein LOC124579074 [Schistocerca americana]|uniref:uncharacterized protein LOC124579074 n=1 Tax=Schistocerca americana TaxID=7009 RepID=UPI001F4F69E0|nr:uncharacterized protein LOC124579074 [Schistocerca americana]